MQLRRENRDMDIAIFLGAGGGMRAFRKVSMISSIGGYEARLVFVTIKQSIKNLNIEKEL